MNLYDQNELENTLNLWFFYIICCNIYDCLNYIYVCVCVCVCVCV